MNRLFTNQWARIVFILLIGLCTFNLLWAQDETTIAPVGKSYALTNVTIIPSPGKKIEKGTVVMKDGLITAVGTSVTIPADAIIIKADSMYVYAGFIDGLSRTGVTKPKEEPATQRPKDPGNPPAEQAGITPQSDVRSELNSAEKSITELRNTGFTVSQVVPYGNFLPGSAAIILLGGKSPDGMVLINQSGLYSELTGARFVYPNTVMAVMAKWRELYKNASLTKSFQTSYASNRNGISRPGSDRVLEAFYPVIDQKIPVVFKAEKILDAQRVLTLRKDLGFSLVMADVKEGSPLINKIKSSGTKVFLSLDLPDEVKKDDKKTEKKEAAKTFAENEKEKLEKRKNEAIAQATAQASDFNKAGMVFGFSVLNAKTKDIQANLRRMIAAGLPEDVALAALTTNAAKLLSLDDRLGTIENGKIANLVVSDKPYFSEKAKVQYVFVDGNMYKMDTKAPAKPDGKTVAKGTWNYTTERSGGKIVIKDDNGSLSGTITSTIREGETELKDVSLDGSSLSFSYEFAMGGNTGKVEVVVKIDGDTFEGTMSVGKFGSFPIKGTRDPKSK
ncbi:MAG: amidohydrolase family protein [Bacteroidetes bacterium]|nr:amidohydrolase family protein [Bacteroidota bacterium]